MVVITVYSDSDVLVIHMSTEASLSTRTPTEMASSVSSLEHTTTINTSTRQGIPPTATSTPSTAVNPAARATRTRITPSSSQIVSTPMTRPSTLAIALISAGIILSFLFFFVSWFIWRRAAHKRSTSTKGSSTESQNNSPKLTSINGKLPRSLSSWDSCESNLSSKLGEVEDEHIHFDENLISPSKGRLTRTVARRNYEGEYQGSKDERQDTIWRLTAPDGSLSLGSQTTGGQGHILVSAFKEDIEGFPQRPQPALRLPLSSILKRPRTPTPSPQEVQTTESTHSSRITAAFQNLLHKPPEAVYRPRFAKEIPKPTNKKMGVRFGMNQIREFGRTPSASAATSLRSGSI